MFQKLSEFFAEAKSEFKKISWPTQDEIKGSTGVVCMTILCVMILLATYDLGILGITKLAQKFLGK